MKARTVKNRINRYVKEFAEKKIPKAFNSSRDRREWVRAIVKAQIYAMLGPHREE